MTLTTAQTTRLAGELRHVNKWYGDHHVLRDVSLRIDCGEIVALIGRSGSGKSTVLRVMAGLSTDHTGNRAVSGAPALAFQEPRLFPWRDVRTNVVYGLTRTRLSKSEAGARADRALADVGLADRAEVWPLTLSGGQAQRVSLARALVAEPELLMLDEPIAGMSARERELTAELLKRICQNRAVIVIEHDMAFVKQIAHKVTVMHQGKILAEGPMEKVQADPKVIDVYLGH